MAYKYYVCVYAICKNESSFVDKWMNSMREADMVVVTDTGSNDNTVQKLKERGAIVHTEIIRPWRFDVARNASLDHVPEDVDICVCTDLDEIFEEGWRKKLEDAWESHQSIQMEPIARNGRYLYNWSLKPDGTPDIQFNYFKIHQRKNFKWVCPVHEYLEYEGEIPLETIYITGMVLNHHPDPNKSRNSYLPLLKMAVKEDPTGERMRYYLGREYMYKEDWRKCIETMKDYLAMPNAKWNEERCAAMRWMAKSYYRLNNIGEAYIWYYRAVAEAPYMRDPYVEFAMMCYECKDWSLCNSLSKTALAIQEKSPTYVNMGYSWNHTLDDLCAIASYYMGRYTTALKYAQEALRYSPSNQRMIHNLQLIQKKITNQSLHQ